MPVNRDLIAELVAEVLSKLGIPDPAGPPPDNVRPASGSSDNIGSNDRPKAHKGTPFVEDVDTIGRPFSDVGTKGGVDDPSQMLRGWTVEAAIGRYLTSPVSLLQVLAQRQRAVALISAEGFDYEDNEGTWSGTGFLVGPNLLLTNHHVLNSVQVASSAKVEFNYEISAENLLLGNGSRPRATQAFTLDPTRLFITSPTSGGLDYTFVWIESAAQNAFGLIPMERSSFTVDEGSQAFVIHHPDGRPKEVSLDDTDIVAITTRIIHYSSDTEKGSSGAPVFDHRGRLIALHHASAPKRIELPDGTHTRVINEGIKIAAIALDLENKMRSGGPDASQAETVLRDIKGSDTMSGFFGGLGRDIPADRVQPEAVVETYRGTDQDIDIGFWNIEWLATKYTDDRKLNGAARVIADLNLDAWGLSEVSPQGVKALVNRIEQTYGDRYEYGLSEPNAPVGKQSTAMIWKKSALSGETVYWPSNVEPLLRQRSDNPEVGIEAVHGNIFDRYPGLFRFTTVREMDEYAFYVVPLHLKAMEEGSLRRRLASRILARAVEDLSTETGLDVILGGDMNAPLASEDFRVIEEAGFTILGAQDEREGAFTYLKGPKSPIDNVFLSPGMKQSVGSVDYFIVAKDRTMSGFIDTVSDHRPVAVRLSLAKKDRPVLPEIGDIDGVIDKLLAAEKSKNSRRRTTKRRVA
ncbi:MAG: trypsin-like peptidase domain-containing protein [Candidatus Binatia bacterium]